MKGPLRQAALAHWIRWSPERATIDDPKLTARCANFGGGVRAVEHSLALLAPLLERFPEAPASLLEAVRLGDPIESLDSRYFPPGLRPTIGWIHRMPVYSALWAQPVATADAAGRIAQAALLVAGAILSENGGTSWGRFSAATESACLAVRKIGKDADTHPSFSKLLTHAKSLHDVIDAVASVRRSESVLTGLQIDVLSGIDVLVRDALGVRLSRAAAKSQELTVAHAPPMAEVGAKDVGDSPRETQSKPRPAHPRTERRVREVDDLVAAHSILEDETEGLPSAEDVAEGAASTSESPRRAVAVVNVPLSVPAHFVGQEAMLWRAKNAARAIATSNQCLLLASDRLQLIDLEAAERYVGEHLKGSRVSDALCQGAIVTAAMLVTSLSIHDIRRIRVVEDIYDVPDRPKWHHLTVEDASLVIPCPELIEGFVPSAADSEHYRPVVERIDVELPRKLKWVQLLIKVAGTKAWAAVFKNPDHVKNASKFISTVNETYGSRLTLARISQFQSRQLSATTGDRADAALLTRGAAGARLYYYSPSINDLSRRYESMWNGVYRGMGVPPVLVLGATVYTESWKEPLEPYVGSSACPTDQGVAQMVEAMVNRFRSLPKGPRHEVRMRQVHNSLVAYTCQLILWHTGIRAVTDPVELGLYDPLTNMLGVSDKNNDSYYSSRVVWVPPIAQRQINAYLQHLVNFQGKFTELASQGMTLFFVDETNGTPSAVGVETLKLQAPESHVYPMNAQRHYLRTRLRELGVRGQSVDALLGHAALGEEPFARHSCFSAARLREDIEAPLLHLSEQAGWVVLHGLKP